MEDFATSIMSLSHSAPLYLFFDVPAFQKHHGGRLHDSDDDGGFEFAAPAGAKNVDDDGDTGAAPGACASDVSAYADELFRGGVLLPLKLPPRLQHPAAAASSAASSAATSPTALGRVQSWSPFATSSRRHRGFDPFAAALEKVRRDGAAPAPRRARSLSPLRGPAGATTGSNSSGTAAAAQTASDRPTWLRRRGVKHFFCRAVMASAAAAPGNRRPRRRRDDGAPCRAGLFVCFGF